jgi:two-component system chemotaxis response regulator CheY
LKDILSAHGECDVVVDGEEAIKAFRLAWEEFDPYALICMDIMMPNMDGQEALKQIREIEKGIGVEGSKEVKVVMITALGDPQNVIEAFYKGGATSYIVKPINKEKLLAEVRSFGLI